MKCKLTHVLLSIRKQTHNLCNSNVFTWIPLIPLNRNWDEQSLYEYFELDIDDINFIQNIKLEGKYNV